MRKFLMPTIAFFVTFAVIFSLFGGVFERVTNIVAPTSAEPIIPEKEDFGVPQKWLDRYGVTLENFIDAKSDTDSDGLTLVEEYKYHTDPTNPDTDSDGYSDGTEVKNGYSPSGKGLMDTNENDIPDKWEKDNMGKLIADKFDDSDKDGLSYYDEYIYGTNPKKSDTDGDSYNDGQEVRNGYEPTVSGEARPQLTITINKINVEVPVVLSKSADEKDLQKDLEHGVIHYPHTAMPGQRGNMYIAGHSSNYIWSKGAYDYAFKGLNGLVEGDEIIITTKFNNGKEINYKYVVFLKEEVASNDSRIFADTQVEELTLTTCWPLGTNLRRLMVKAQLEEN